MCFCLEVGGGKQKDDFEPGLMGEQLLSASFVSMIDWSSNFNQARMYNPDTLLLGKALLLLIWQEEKFLMVPFLDSGVTVELTSSRGVVF